MLQDRNTSTLVRNLRTSYILSKGDYHDKARGCEERSYKMSLGLGVLEFIQGVSQMYVGSTEDISQPHVFYWDKVELYVIVN